MYRVALLIAFAAVFAFRGNGIVLAQDQPPAIGTEIPFTGADGAAALVTITEIADPFEEYDPDQPPGEGTRYVLLTVTFENAGQRPFDANPSELLVQDSDGYLWGTASVPRPDDAVMPALESQKMAPGNRISGVVGFVVPEAAKLSNVLYQPESGRLVPLVDLAPGSSPRLGDGVAFANPDGGQAMITVAEVTDPFDQFDESRPPQEGGRYVLMTVAVENTGDRPVEANPSYLLLRDADGYLWGTTSDPRPSDDIVIPQLESQKMAPGNRISGIVAFVVPVDVAVSGLYYGPESSRLILLADLAAGTDAATDGQPDATGTASAADCPDADAWLAATTTRVDRASAMSRDVATLDDLAQLEAYAAEYAELADAQRAETVPSGAEAINRALVATLGAYADSLNQILTADEPGKDPAIELVEAVNTFNAAGERMGQIQAQLAKFSAECGLG